MKRLSREEILNVKDIEQKEVSIPEWKGSVLVQALSGKKRAEIMDACMNDKGKMNTEKLYPALIVAGCIEPEFKKADAEALNNKNSGALEKVCKVIMKLSGISQDDVEEAEKN
jgi:hypothetical protein